MEFLKADETTKVKQEFPIYEDQSNMELLCKLIRSFRKSVEAYDLFKLLGEAEVYDHFKQCLAGDVLDTWEAIVVDEEKAEWDANLAQLVETLIDEDVYTTQKDYLSETKKPSNMPKKNWILRLKAINTYLPILNLSENAESFDEEGLVKIITRNIPNSWKARFKMVNGHRSTTVAQAQKILHYIEKEDARVTKSAYKGGGQKTPKNKKYKNKKKKPEDEGHRKIGNPCKLPNHGGHDWSNCFFNPKSKNFKGVARTPKDYDSDGKLKKEVKEKEQNFRNEKKEKNKTTYESDESSDSDPEEFHMTEKSTKIISDNTKKERSRSSELLLSIPCGVGSKKNITVLALADTGSTSTLGNINIFGPRCRKKVNTKPTGWNTQAGDFQTTSEGHVDRVKLPQFSTKRSFGADFHLFQPGKGCRYDVIIGQDLLQELGIDILNSSKSFHWDGIEVPMVPRGHWDKKNIRRFWKQHENSDADDETALVLSRRIEETYAMKKILAAKYEPINLTKVVDEQEHLAIPERLALQKILKTYLNLFQGLRGNWKGKPIHLEFVPGSKPHTSRPFPIPQAYRRLVKEEVARLVEIGLLTKVEASEWSSPSFAIPKKNNTIRFVTDFRVLNTKLLRKPYHLPLIQEILHNLGQFRYATCVDLNMGYYSMKLDEESQKSV